MNKKTRSKAQRGPSTLIEGVYLAPDTNLVFSGKEGSMSLYHILEDLFCFCFCFLYCVFCFVLFRFVVVVVVVVVFCFFFCLSSPFNPLLALSYQSERT